MEYKSAEGSLRVLPGTNPDAHSVALDLLFDPGCANPVQLVVFGIPTFLSLNEALEVVLDLDGSDAGSTATTDDVPAIARAGVLAVRAAFTASPSTYCLLLCVAAPGNAHALARRLHNRKVSTLASEHLAVGFLPSRPGPDLQRQLSRPDVVFAWTAAAGLLSDAPCSEPEVAAAGVGVPRRVAAATPATFQRSASARGGAVQTPVPVPPSAPPLAPPSLRGRPRSLTPQPHAAVAKDRDPAVAWTSPVSPTAAPASGVAVVSLADLLFPLLSEGGTVAETSSSAPASAPIRPVPQRVSSQAQREEATHSTRLAHDDMVVGGEEDWSRGLSTNSFGGGGGPAGPSPAVSSPSAAAPSPSSPLLQPSSTPRHAPPVAAAVNEQHGCSICLEPFHRHPTIQLPCAHTFDLPCFARVNEGVCPLCRFNITEARSSCSHCPATSDLWMCLVCGDVLCGRYRSRHVLDHYAADPTHRYMMQVGGLRVWDLGRDTLVHRVIATSVGGVTGTSMRLGGDDEAGGDAEPRPPRVDWFSLCDTPPSTASDDDDVYDDPAGSYSAPKTTDALSKRRRAAARREEEEVETRLRSRIDAIEDFYSEMLHGMLAAQHAHFARQRTAAVANELAEQRMRALDRARLEDDERTARQRVVRAALRDRAVLVEEASLVPLSNYARGLRDGVASSSSATSAASTTHAMRAVKERRETAEAHVAALRGNVTRLEEMLHKSSATISVSADGAAAVAATAASTVPAETEVARLERQLAALYAQFE